MLIPVIPATVEPVTLAEAKADLRMTHDADDALISSQIASARATVEGWTGLALAAATYRQTYGDVSAPVGLPLLPAVVDNVTSVTDGVREPVSDYTADDVAGVVRASGRSVVVEFTTAPTPLLPQLRTAILLLVRREYEASPDEQAKLFDAALATAFQCRRNLGV